MPDTYTGQATLPFAQTAFDLKAFYALRPQLYYDALADIEPSDQAMVGSSVTFSFQNDLAIASTPLSESVDVSAQAMSASNINYALAEYGNAIITTALGRGTSFLDWDKLVTNVLGFNAGISLDTLAQIVLMGATNHFYAVGAGTNVPSSIGTINSSNTLTAGDVRHARALLRRANVPDIDGMYFMFIHPDMAYDLMGQTGNATWNEPHAYNAPGQIWTGELGSFQGFRFVETPRAPELAGSGSTGINVFEAIAMGRQALAKGYSYVDGNNDYPTIVPGPVTDHLRRFVPWGWYWLGVYGIFRQACVWLIQGASSIN